LSTSCPVCEKHHSRQGLPGGAIAEDEFWFIAHFPWVEGPPPHYGHVIAEVRRHITDPARLTREEAASLGLWTQKISAALASRLEAEHVYIFRIGDQTPHLHFHFVPRFKDTPKEAWGTGLYQSPRGRKASVNDIKNISSTLAQALRGST
jgi:diadenosine tetraphosphate (Ap4A) HIT family hydrolase